MGKENNHSSQNKLIGISGTVVKNMLSDLSGQGRTLYVDNWYTSPVLFKQLLDEKTNACGMVRLKRKHLPKINTKRMKVGEIKIMHTPKMALLVWKDKKVVSMLTTTEHPQIITTNKTDKRTGELKKKGKCCGVL